MLDNESLGNFITPILVRYPWSWVLRKNNIVGRRRSSILRTYIAFGIENLRYFSVLIE